MKRILWEDGSLPRDTDNLADDGFASFRELILFVKKRNGLIKKLFWPDEYVIVEGRHEIGDFSGGFLDFDGRRFACAKHTLVPSETTSPVVIAVMEEGTDLPLYQCIKHHSIVSAKRTSMLQFIRSVPNSRIWKKGKGFTIQDESRKLLAQILIDDETLKPPEPGVALIHLREDLDSKLAQELVAVLFVIKFIKG